jgi:hypothetical protein
MDDPVREAVIHHRREIRQLDLVAMQMDAARRAVKCQIKHAVVAFAEQIEVVLQLFAGIAGQMAEFRLHGLRDQLERRQDVELVLDMAIPHRFETSNISLSISHPAI